MGKPPRFDARALTRVLGGRAPDAERDVEADRETLPIRLAGSTEKANQIRDWSRCAARSLLRANFEHLRIY